MKFAHIADVHLGTQKETPYLYEGFLNFLDYVELHPVDMIFITGDLFDHVPTKEELVFVDTQLARLDKTDIIYVTGECDYLSPKSIVWDYEFVSRMYVLNGEEIHNHVEEAERAVRNSYAEGILDSLHFPKHNVDIYGICQYNARNTRNDFDGVYARNLREINIFLGHGGDEMVCPYDPEDFSGRNFSYIGLGHKHQSLVFEKQHIYYPGSLEPITEKETGEHGFFYGYLDKQLTSVRFIPLAMRRYEEQPDANLKIDYARLYELNSQNAFGSVIRQLEQTTEKVGTKAKEKYMACMYSVLQAMTGSEEPMPYTETQIAEAQKETKETLQQEIKKLQQGIFVCETEKQELSEKLLACPDQTGMTNVLHEDIGKLKFELGKLEYEEQQVDKRYSRRRLGFVLWIDTPIALVLAFLCTFGVIDVFFMQAWNAWFRLVCSLFGFEILCTMLGFVLYNGTKKLRKKLFGTEVPVETHARLQSDIRFLEQKIHDLELEESTRFLDQKTYDENTKKMRDRNKQYEMLLELSEIDLRILECIESI